MQKLNNDNTIMSDSSNDSAEVIVYNQIENVETIMNTLVENIYKDNSYQEYLKDPQAMIGRFYKYRFQLENDDTTVVRHPTGVAFRDIDLPPDE